MRKGRRNGWLTISLGLMFLLPAYPLASSADNAALFEATQASASPLQMSSTDTRRFVAVHGRRSVVMGYPQTGLEVWAYPLQILSGYQIGFRPGQDATETDGRLLLRRIIERPDSVTRVYAGPDYVVRETLFVPLDQPAAILTYSVRSEHSVLINVHFKPVLDLMWPGSLGGQSTSWDGGLPGYVLEEPAHGLRAVVASPEITMHNATVNSTLHASGKLAFAIEPRVPQGAEPGSAAVASVFITLLSSPLQKAASAVAELASHAEILKKAANQHYEHLSENALRISTPDPDVNSALAWAEVALDQAWVCNPQLGCGTVGGYGPSRGARRPQYDWFFAGDELVAANALIAAGEYDRARDELLFIMKYQDQKTGMIWHELSQSAGYIDWSKYPYMFVHVDISFDFLNAVANYVSASGDVKFASDHWNSIDAAYRYCRSLIGDDGLPHIPAGKEGADEQHRPAQDLGLSTSWAAAASGYAALTKAAGHPELAEEALKENQRARKAIAAHYWDPEHHFWINGYTARQTPIFTRRSGPADAITQDIFSPQQDEELLNQIASSAFRTDWGVRSVATDSPIYDPWSYASGSVSALHSAEIAAMFWAEDRPEIAWSTWISIVPWNRLDSLGHIHEVLAGNYYREQTESVPEQTWSSAGLLDSAVRGLLGLAVEGAKDRVVFRPHLPAEWDHISVANIHLPQSTLALSMRQTMDSVDLDIQDKGVPVALLFQPQVPLGAHLVSTNCGGHATPAQRMRFNGDEHISAQIVAPSGVSHCRIRFTGGVSVILPPHPPHVGDSSTGAKLTQLTLNNGTLSLDLDIRPAKDNFLFIRTPWKIARVTGAFIQPMADNLYKLRIDNPDGGSGRYRPISVYVIFAQTNNP